MRAAKSRPLSILFLVLAAANFAVTGFLAADGACQAAFSQAIIAALCFLLGYIIWE